MCAWLQSPHRSSNRENSDKAKSQHIPPEFLEEIFQRLPVKSLVKCICVCKDWKSIITNQAFMLAHISYRAKANNNVSDSLFLQYQAISYPIEQEIESGHNLSVRSNDQEASCHAIIRTSLSKNMSDLDVVGICNGLVCFVKYSESREFDGFIIMNLSIRKHVVLPKPEETMTFDHTWDCRLFGFGFDSRNKDFKVVMLVVSFSKRQLRFPTRVEVYSLATGKWRSIIHGVPSICFCSYRRPRYDLTLVNGALHWISCASCKNQHRSCISTFDLAEETFGEIMLPNFCDELCLNPYLLVRGSCLALACQKLLPEPVVTYIVRVMKEYGVVDSWDLVFSVWSMQYPGVRRILALTSSEKVVVETFDQRVLLLDYHLNNETVLVPGQRVGFASDHVESLFLINHKENNAYDNNEGILDVHFVSQK
ncbi:hypothetical protein K1719_040261 [Acacia pycnantha]|nr:hypothetical protein K1719_040261 [Acacia pycnantha]